MNEFELPKTKEEKMVTESRTPLSLKELVNMRSLKHIKKRLYQKI